MKLLLFLIILSIGVFSSAQDYEKGVFRLKLKSDIAKPSKLKVAGKLTDDEKLNAIFKKHEAIYYEQAYPFAKNPEILKIYKVKFKGNDEHFKNELETSASDLIEDIEPIPIPIADYEPSDYAWYQPSQQDPNGWLWHLKRMQANKAWDITKGNSNIKIGIVDTDFDILHPDLSSKISPNYDPMTNIIHSASGASHGTTVASFAAAQTDGGGQLASSGFNSTIVAYTWDDGVGKALHASDVMNVDVISISWHHCSASTLERLMIQEILDNGTIIVAAAGNGSVSCSGGPIPPFSPVVDSRIICVTSVGEDDKHFNSSGTTHSDYPEVSICAPGYSVMGATPTTTYSGLPVAWPYFGGCTGTSFATPIVAGVCALMKSINPCLNSESAKAIIQANADPVLDADDYIGLIGPGKINAYKAVMAAGTKEYNSTTLSGNMDISAGYGFNLINVTIGNSSNINLTARMNVDIFENFEVPIGSTFSIEMEPDVQSSCE